MCVSYELLLIVLIFVSYLTALLWAAGLLMVSKCFVYDGTVTFVIIGFIGIRLCFEFPCRYFL